MHQLIRTLDEENSHARRLLLTSFDSIVLYSKKSPKQLIRQHPKNDVDMALFKGKRRPGYQIKNYMFPDRARHNHHSFHLRFSYMQKILVKSENHAFQASWCLIDHNNLTLYCDCSQKIKNLTANQTTAQYNI